MTKLEKSPPREQATRLKIGGSNRASSGKNSIVMDLPWSQSVSVANSLGRSNMTLDPNSLYIMSPEQFSQIYPGGPQPKNAEEMMEEKYIELIQEADVKLKDQPGRFYVNTEKLTNLAHKKILRKEYKDAVDMRSLVGYLNQNEWIYAINIGNIMQINLLSMAEVYSQNGNGQGLNSNDAELLRDHILEKLSLLIVSYFCVSTEYRFLVQLQSNNGDGQPETLTKEEVQEKTACSQFWHSKALELACAFLPNECPLLNHILLSYQKHHAPTAKTIPEDEELTDKLEVVHPLKGIENPKFHPIIRSQKDSNIQISPRILEQPPSKKKEVPLLNSEMYYKYIQQQQAYLVQINHYLQSAYNQLEYHRQSQGTQNPTARRVQLDSRTTKITIPITTRTKLNSTTVSDGASGGSTGVSVSIPGRRGSSKGGNRKEPNSLRGPRPMGSLPRSATRKGPSPDSLNISGGPQHRMHFVVSQQKRAGAQELRKDSKERPHTSAAIGAMIPPHIREIENLGMSRREQILAQSQAVPRKLGQVFRPPPPGYEGKRDGKAFDLFNLKGRRLSKGRDIEGGSQRGVYEKGRLKHVQPAPSSHLQRDSFYRGELDEQPDQNGAMELIGFDREEEKSEQKVDAQGSQGTSVKRDKPNEQGELRLLRAGKQFPASASELLLLSQDQQSDFNPFALKQNPTSSGDLQYLQKKKGKVEKGGSATTVAAIYARDGLENRSKLKDKRNNIAYQIFNQRVDKRQSALTPSQLLKSRYIPQNRSFFKVKGSPSPDTQFHARGNKMMGSKFHKLKRNPSPNQSVIGRSGTPSGMLESMDHSGIDIPANISMFEMGAPSRPLNDDFK